jgi:hypothetical protein
MGLIFWSKLISIIFCKNKNENIVRGSHPFPLMKKGERKIVKKEA